MSNAINTSIWRKFCCCCFALVDDDDDEIHPSIAEPISRICAGADSGHYFNKLLIRGRNGRPIDGQSLGHLVDFIVTCDNFHPQVVITELDLWYVQLLQPPDGGLEVLQELFSSSDTTLTKVTLRNCNFGSQQDASQLIAAFQTNGSVTDLTIQDIHNMEGVASGSCLSSLIQNMPQLQRLCCNRVYFTADGIRPFQPALQANRTLRELNFSSCQLQDEGIHLLADSLVGNTTMDKLNISENHITPNGLAAGITRLLVSTHLHTINFSRNKGAFNDNDATRHFAVGLGANRYVKQLNIADCELGDEAIHLVADGLVGNNNTTLGGIDMYNNHISSTGLNDITRMIESTQLKTINCSHNGLHNRGLFWHGVFWNDTAATEHFIATLQQKSSTVQELPGINEMNFRGESGSTVMYANIKNSLTRNQHLNCINLLLAPTLPPPPSQQQQQRLHHDQSGNNDTVTATTTTTTTTSDYLIKVWHKAITKFSNVPNNAGASAIFKLFQAQPALWICVLEENRLLRPAVAAAAAAATAAAISSGPQ